MFKKRSLKSFGRILNKKTIGERIANVGRRMLADAENNAEIKPEIEIFESHVKPLGYVPVEMLTESIICEQLSLLRSRYLKARHQLEVGHYDPSALTEDQEIVLNSSHLFVPEGFYSNYIFQGYSKGMLHFMGPIGVLELTSNGFRSIDPSIYPHKHINFLNLMGHFKIEFKHPANCLLNLANESTFFTANVIPNLEQRLYELAKTI